MHPACNYDFTKMIQPAPLTARFEDPGHIVWCGSGVRHEHGKYHLFYSRWPKELGHYAWVTHSEIAHAVADHPLGPYRFTDVALPERGAHFWDGLCTHNPTIHRFNGRYYLYYMGNTGDRVHPPDAINWTHRNNQRIGVAVADNPAGPWTRTDTPLLDCTPGFHDALCLNNPSVTQRPDGSILMVYKAVADKGKPPFGGPVVHIVATANHPTGPFTKHPNPVFTAAGVHFPAEDPFIWRGHDRYWAIVKDFLGHFTHAGPSLALFESPDGITWRPAKHPLVSTLQLKLTDGTTTPLEKLERPQLLLDNGEPSILFCAAAPAGQLDESFLAILPLRRVIT